MAEETVSVDTLVKRLKRIEGQIRGIQKMIEQGRDCESIITQVGAVRSAIEGVGGLILSNYMKFCFSGGNKPSLDNICSLARAVGIWGRLRVGD